MVGGSGRAYSDPEVELPVRPQIEINGRDKLLLLLVQRIEPGNRSVRGVILEPSCNPLGEVVSHFHVGREDYALMYAGAVKRTVKRGIEAQIPGADLLVYDRTNLPRPGIGREAAGLIATLVR